MSQKKDELIGLCPSIKNQSLPFAPPSPKTPFSVSDAKQGQHPGFVCQKEGVELREAGLLIGQWFV